MRNKGHNLQLRLFSVFSGIFQYPEASVMDSLPSHTFRDQQSRVGSNGAMFGRALANPLQVLPSYSGECSER